MKEIAYHHKISVAEVRRQMAYAIEIAKNNSAPEKQTEFQRLFGNRIPSPEELFCTISKNLTFK